MIIKIGTKLKRVSTTIDNELTGGKTYTLNKNGGVLELQIVC